MELEQLRDALPDEAELRALLEKATPGPWHWYAEDYSCAILCGETNGHADPLKKNVTTVSICEACRKRAKGSDNPHWVWGRCTSGTSDDAALIRAARNALPTLLDRLEKMREALETLEQSAAAEVALFESNINGACMNDYGTPGYVPSSTLSAWSGSLTMARHLHRQIEAARNALSQGEVKDQTT